MDLMKIDLRDIMKYCNSCGCGCHDCEFVDDSDNCLLDTAPSNWQVEKIEEVVRKIQLKGKTNHV